MWAGGTHAGVRVTGDEDALADQSVRIGPQRTEILPGGVGGASPVGAPAAASRVGSRSIAPESRSVD